MFSGGIKIDQWHEMDLKSCLRHLIFFKGSLLIPPLYLQPFLVSDRVSVSFTKRVAFIHSLKNTTFNLTGDLTVIHCLRNYFSSGMFVSEKKLGLVLRSFGHIIFISIEELHPSGTV